MSLKTMLEKLAGRRQPADAAPQAKEPQWRGGLPDCLTCPDLVGQRSRCPEAMAMPEELGIYIPSRKCRFAAARRR